MPLKVTLLPTAIPGRSSVPTGNSVDAQNCSLPESCTALRSSGGMTLMVSWSEARDSTQRLRGLVCSGIASKT